MASASFMQTSFLGGEWSPYYQGRADSPKYRIAMNVCFNGVLLEEGVWTRRPGSKFLATTRHGVPGRIIPYTFNEQFPYTLEFTDGHLRFYNGTNLLLQPDIANLLSVTSDSPSVFSTTATDWVAGDLIEFVFNSVGDSADAAVLQNRQLVLVSKFNAQQFTLADPITGVEISSNIGFVPERDNIQVGKIVDIDTPWSDGTWANIRAIQTSAAVNTAVALTGPPSSVALVVATAAPQLLSVANYPRVNISATFTLTGWPDSFVYGPFLDPINSIATPSGDLSLPTFTLDFAFPVWEGGVVYGTNQYVNSSGLSYISLVPVNVGNPPVSSPTKWRQIDNGLAFSAAGGAQPTDVGRSIRLFNQPLLWDPGTSYAKGDIVQWNDNGYLALAANVGVQPDQSIVDWAVQANAFLWYQGLITAVNSSTEVVVTVGANLIYQVPITIWQLGLYTATGPVWPTCGAFLEGRIWFGGAIPNRVDASSVVIAQSYGNIFDFIPTDPFGNVPDSYAIAYTFNSGDANQIRWMSPAQGGLLVGTEADEWLITASQLNDPITPSSIQARPITKYGGAFVEPKRVGLGLAMVQKYGRRLLELITDFFSGKFSAPSLSEPAKHLTVSGLAELAHQEELFPCVWARLNNGNLVGCTYRRNSALATEPPLFSGWHRHTLGSGRIVTSIGVGPTPGGELDMLTMVTADPAHLVNNPNYHVEVLTDLFDEDSTIYDAWFLDNAVTPTGSDVVTYGGKTYVRFYGLWHLNGKTVTVWAGGLDCGDYAVSGGSVDVPFGAAGGLFTQAYLITLSNSGTDFGGLATSVDDFSYGPIIPVVSNGIVRAYNQFPAFASGFSELQITPNWGTNTFYLTNDGYTGNDGIWQYNIDSGAIINSNTATALWAPGEAFVAHPLTLATDGNLYWCGGVEAFGPFIKVNGQTLQPITTFGNGSFTSWAESIPKPSSLCGIAVSGVADGTGNPTITSNYLVIAGTFTANVTIWNIDGQLVNNVVNGVPFWTGFEQAVVMGGDPAGTIQTALVAGAPNTGMAFGLCHPDFFAGASTSASQPLYCFTIDNTGVCSGVLRGMITPQDIDPRWSTQAVEHMASGFWYDPSDGNLMFTTGTLDSGVTNRFYLVKIRASDAKVLWTVPLPGVVEGNSLSQVRGNTFVYLIGSDAYVVDTATGAFGVTATPGVSGNTGSVFNAETGVVLSFLIYTGTTPGAPSPAPGSPIDFSGLWAKFTLGDAFSAQFVANNTRLTIPCVIGFTYTSQGQTLRPLAPADTGAQNGPGFAKPRRNAQFGALLDNTQGISFGTDFEHLHAAQFQTDGGIKIIPPALYSGIHWDTVDDDSSFDGQLCWQITRPYPASLMAIGGFIKTQDR